MCIRDRPTVEELAQFSGMDKEEILFALESSASMQYLYEVIHQDDGSPVLLIDCLLYTSRCV